MFLKKGVYKSANCIIQLRFCLLLFSLAAVDDLIKIYMDFV